MTRVSRLAPTNPLVFLGRQGSTEGSTAGGFLWAYARHSGMSRFGQVTDAVRGFSIQAIKGLASTRFALFLDGKIQGGPGRSGTAGGPGSTHGDQEHGSLSENCVAPMRELHLNFECEAVRLSCFHVSFAWP